MHMVTHTNEIVKLLLFNWRLLGVRCAHFQCDYNPNYIQAHVLAKDSSRGFDPSIIKADLHTH